MALMKLAPKTSAAFLAELRKKMTISSKKTIKSRIEILKDSFHRNYFKISSN